MRKSLSTRGGVDRVVTRYANIQHIHLVCREHTWPPLSSLVLAEAHFDHTRVHNRPAAVNYTRTTLSGALVRALTIQLSDPLGTTSSFDFADGDTIVKVSLDIVFIEYTSRYL